MATVRIQVRPTEADHLKERKRRHLYQIKMCISKRVFVPWN